MNQPPQEPLDIVIFGGAGDLSLRKLIPALYMAHLHGSLPASCRIVGVGRQTWSAAEYATFLSERARPFVAEGAMDPTAWGSFVERLDFATVDATQPESFAALQRSCARSARRVYYLATAPSLFAPICQQLSSHGLIDERARVVLEKPLGHDLESAQAINDEVARHFAEQQIYRIDHYLGKETVQNLMVLRFGNAIFEPLWRAPNIRSVQITVAESVGVGSRAGFYDHTGALRDMVQNHLLQLLCIVAMEAPISLNPDDVRDEKLRVLRSLKALSLSDIQRDTVRGQYTAGNVGAEAVPGYLQEADVPAGSPTETFVALKAHVNNARWAHVPFFLRTGKRMQRRRSEIIIEFDELPFSVFSGQPGSHPNRLVIGLQPEESIQLQVMVKEPGSGMKMQRVDLNLDLQSTSRQRRPEAYERLLMDVVNGKLTHFMRRDELEAAWRWVDPIVRGWQELAMAPKPYPAGSWGPAASSALMAREGLTWFEEA